MTDVLPLTLGWFAILMTTYYALLAVLATRTLVLSARQATEADDRLDPPDEGDEPLYVVVVPARNERVVIGPTVERALALDGCSLIIVMDDGSDDGTGDAAIEAAGGDPRLQVVTREPEIAGRGKGAVLNHAVEVIEDLRVSGGHPQLRELWADEVVVCVLDADGWLSPGALRAVTPCFRDPTVAGVQLPVRMWNARAGFLARMQDIEFVGYGFLFQAAREQLGSVLMGGNGQFVRLSALLDLGAEPWTDSLTEDLDLGLRLVHRGWTHRFCPNAYVAQQAVPHLRRFVRQRTRWVQGHLSCWSHLPLLWRRGTPVGLTARLDLTLHLLLGMFGFLLALQGVVVAGTAMGLTEGFVAVPMESNAHLAATLLLLLAVIPVALIGTIYQRQAEARLPGPTLLGVLLVYALYHYAWSIPATAIALSRITARRRSWAKTARSAITDHDLAAEAVIEQGAT